MNLRPARVSTAIVLVGSIIFASAAPKAEAADDKAACVSAYEKSQVARRERKWKRAREELRTCSRAACPALVRNDCVSWLEQVNASYPSIVIRGELDGSDVADVRVFEDGVLITSRLDGNAMEVEPGEHAFRFETEGAPPVSMTIVAREGEKNRAVPVNFVSPRAASAQAHEGPTSRPVPVGTYVLGGVGIAALGVFAVMAASGKSSESNLRDTCAPYCAKSDIDSVRAKYTVADIGLGVGIASLAGAAVWYFLRPAQREEGSPPPATGLAVSPTKTGMTVGWTGSF